MTVACMTDLQMCRPMVAVGIGVCGRTLFGISLYTGTQTRLFCFFLQAVSGKRLFLRNSRFLASPKLKQAWLWSFGLSKTMVCLLPLQGAVVLSDFSVVVAFNYICGCPKRAILRCSLYF